MILGASFTLGPGVGFGLAAVCIVETLFTAALVFVVLSVATTAQDEGNWYYGLAIGFTVMAAAFAIAPISGCSLNPAVTFGVMMSHWWHTGKGMWYFPLYILCPLVGGGIGALLFRFVRDAEFRDKRQQHHDAV